MQPTDTVLDVESMYDRVEILAYGEEEHRMEALEEGGDSVKLCDISNFHVENIFLLC